MAYESAVVKSGTLLAGADLSALQYTFVKLNTAGAVVACSVAGEKAIGVLQNAPKSGEPCEIVHIGFCPVKANAAIANTGTIMTAATGKAAASATTGSTILGWLAEASGADGEIVTAFVNCGAGVV